MKNVSLIALFVMIFVSPLRADVYLFEEDYDAAPVTTIADLGEEEVIEEVVIDEPEARFEEEVVADSSSRSSFYKYNSITFKNFGTVFINLAKGVGVLYKDLFTEAFPSYGTDLVSIPAVSAELGSQMIDIERKALFEANAKQKEIDDYREASQRPLTPEQQQLLEELQAKQ